MKTNRTKILSIAISVLLLLGCLIGISAMAEEETTAPEVEITFNNLEYGDNISILYATKVNGATPEALKMNFYTMNEEGEYVIAASTTEYETYDITVRGETGTYNVFKSPGIAPKFMPEIVYAQLVAVIDGVEYKSDMSRFSVVEYCYKRLYKDTGITADQKDLYTYILGYGTAAQKVLNYKTDSTPASYYYVNAEGAVVDTVEIDGATYSFSAGIFKPGKSVALNYNGALGTGEYAVWKTVYTLANGENSSETLDDNSEITVSDKHIVTVPKIMVDPTNYFDNANDLDRYTMTNKSDEVHFNTTIVDDPAPAYDGDKAFKLTMLYSSGQQPSSIKVPVSGDEGNLYVLTYDVRWTYSVTNAAGTGTTSTGNGNVVQYNFYKDGTSTASVRTNFKYDRVVQPSGYFGLMYSSGNGQGETSYNNLAGFIIEQKWYTVRQEIYYTGSGFVSRLFINDIFVAEDKSYNATANPIDYVSINTANNNTYLYYDNLSFVRTNGEYAEIKDNIVGSASGTGVYYNDENNIGFRADFTTKDHETYGITEPKNIAPSAHKDTRFLVGTYRSAFDNGYAIYRSESTGSARHMYMHHGNNSTPSDKFVIEMDVAFGNVKEKAGGAFFFIRGIAGSIGKNSDLYFGSTADGKVKVGLWASVTNGTAPILDANTWYNLRMEFCTNGSINIYVDGEFACTVTGLDYNRFSQTSASFLMHQNATDEYLAYDNIFVGFANE